MRTAFLALFPLLMMVGAVSGQSSEPQNVALTSLLQDEPVRLPEDNMARFSSAAKEVNVQLDLLSMIGAQSLEGTVVTLIDADGKEDVKVADASGLVKFEEVTEGPHALVASNDNSHGSTLLVLSQVDNQDVNPLEEDVVEAKPIETARVTLLQIDPHELVPIVDDIADPVGTAPSVMELTGFERLQTESPFGFSVRLQNDGTLLGRVIVAGSAAQQASLSGTTVFIYRQGRRIAVAKTDALGRFQVIGMRPGVHGLVAAGPAGYAAMAFEALQADFVNLLSSSSGVTFVAAMAETKEELPVVLVPPKLVPKVASTIRRNYPGISTRTSPQGTPAPMTPGAISAGLMAGGSAMSGTTGSSGYSGGSGGGITGGGGGGLGLLAAAVAIPVAISAADDDDNPGPIASPSE